MKSADLDRDERMLIRSTAFAVLRNGTSFYEWLRVKRGADPSYAFLYGGIGSEYYKWCLANKEEAEKEEEDDKLVKVAVQETVDVATRPGTSMRSRHDERSHSRSRSVSRRRFRSPPRDEYRRRHSPDRRRPSPERRRRDSPPVRRRRPDSPDRVRRRESPKPHRRRRSRSHRRSHSREVWVSKPAKRVEEAPTTSKLHAWSDDENPPSNLLRQKLAAMKQKLTE